jgi:protein-disulfide isomerase
MQRKNCAILFRLGTAVLTCLTVFVFIADAQSTRRRPRTKPSPARPAAATAPVAKPPAVPPADMIATVNGNPITMAEIEPDVRTLINQDPDPYLRNFYEDPAKEIATARPRALEARINSLLIATEAKKQRKTAEEFRQIEINNRLLSPTEQEIQGVFEANRAAFGAAAFADVRPQIINYLRSQRAEELYVNLANRLRMTNLVTKGADVNSPNLAPATVLATVAGTPITAGSLDERMKVYVYDLRLRIYQIQKIMLDRKINDQLLLAEATRKNIRSDELVRAEITDKRRPPTEAEIKQFYDENRERIPGDLASVRAEISQFLETQQQEKLEIALSERLRNEANFKVLLPEPKPPVQMISRDDDPARGDKNAAVTIIEFTDFQCPACGALYPIIEEVLRGYGNSVHFVVRDFPLAMHADSRKAAEAANAAHAQGKFFEYIALLFKNQKALDTDSLKKYAGSLGLDQKRFDMELDSGMYAAEVQHDVEDGESYGMHGTPTIFVNGINVKELSAEGLRAAIDGAMGKRAPASKP